MAGYVSPFGPKMRPTALRIGGWPLKALAPVGIASAAFGGVALFTLIFIGEGITRVQDDVLKKVPFANKYWLNKKPIPESDSPF